MGLFQSAKREADSKERPLILSRKGQGKGTSEEQVWSGQKPES